MDGRAVMRFERKVRQVRVDVEEVQVRVNGIHGAGHRGIAVEIP